MKPAPFLYCDPTTVAEAVGLLAEYGTDAKLLAGGQSLVPLLNMRLSRPRVLVDLNRVAELSYLEPGQDGGLRAGALTRHRTLETSPLVRERLPVLQEAARHIGHRAVRTRGTLGGSLAHADPAAELPAVAALLEAQMVLAGPAGRRTVPAGEFFVTYLTTALEPTEVLVEVRLPALPPGAGWGFVEVARRQGDIALAGVAAMLCCGPGGRISAARLALTGVGPAPLRPQQAEELLLGQDPGQGLWEAAAAGVRAAVEPESDLHASAEYRRHLAGVLTVRALAAAWERAAKQP